MDGAVVERTAGPGLGTTRSRATRGRTAVMLKWARVAPGAFSIVTPVVAWLLSRQTPVRLVLAVLTSCHRNHHAFELRETLAGRRHDVSRWYRDVKGLRLPRLQLTEPICDLRPGSVLLHGKGQRLVVVVGAALNAADEYFEHILIEAIDEHAHLARLSGGKVDCGQSLDVRGEYGKIFHEVVLALLAHRAACKGDLELVGAEDLVLVQCQLDCAEEGHKVSAPYRVGLVLYFLAERPPDAGVGRVEPCLEPLAMIEGVIEAGQAEVHVVERLAGLAVVILGSVLAGLLEFDVDLEVVEQQRVARRDGVHVGVVAARRGEQPVLELTLPSGVVSDAVERHEVAKPILGGS